MTEEEEEQMVQMVQMELVETRIFNIRDFYNCSTIFKNLRDNNFDKLI
jgi:hypothetical protein